MAHFTGVESLSALVECCWDVSSAVPRQNLIRLGQERRDPSIRPQAKTPSLVGGRATGIVRPSALHGHTGVAMEDGEQVG